MPGHQGSRASGQQGHRASGQQDDRAAGQQNDRAAGQQGDRAAGQQGDRIYKISRLNFSEHLSTHLTALLLSLEYDLWVLEIGYYSIESAIQIGYPYIFFSIKATKTNRKV